MAAALAQVKRAWGDRAVILRTRNFCEGGVLGVGGRNVVEITATDDAGAAAESGRTTAPSREPPLVEAARSRIGELGVTPARDVERDDGPSHRLAHEVEAIRDMVQQVLSETRRGRQPDLSDDLLAYYTRLIGQHVADEIARRLIDEVRAALIEEHPTGSFSAADVETHVADRIARMLPHGAPLTIGNGQRKVVALVGPTGVGKTTTAAKLAAQFKLRERRRVGLITADTYRIAAVEQLKVYASILDVPLEVVMSPQDMPAAMDRLASCDLVLIDTAGRSQRDASRLSELKRHLDAARPDEVHLVVAGNVSEAAALEVIRRFSVVAPHRLIFSKIDEAVTVGLILNVLAHIGPRISYLTTGQSVPNDIEPATGRRLAELILRRPVASSDAPPCAHSGPIARIHASDAARLDEGKALLRSA